MRFLHTADWHLGKRLHDFSLQEQQREALEGIVEIVAGERPDAVVLAGDVFDTHVPPLWALELWEYAVDAIVAELGVPMVVIPGNHDHADRISLNSNLASRAGLHILRRLRDCARPVVIEGVPIYGVPFHKPAHVNSTWRSDAPGIGDFDYQAAMRYALARIHAERSDKGPAVLVGHAFVAGADDELAEGEGEDAIQVGGAGAVSPGCFEGFSYVALGHIHGCRRLGDDGEVHYSGSPCKYSFDESRHGKSVTMVELGGNGAVTWERLPVEVSRDVRILEGLSFDEVLLEARSTTPERRDDYLLVRVTDRDPIDQALARLREWYPNCLLEQPAIEVRGKAPELDGDYRALSVEDAFRQFYLHVYGEELEGVEEELLYEALAGGEDGASAGPGPGRATARSRDAVTLFPDEADPAEADAFDVERAEEVR